MPNVRRAVATLISAATLACLSGHALAAPPTYTVIALSGQPAPNLPGITLDALADPRVDDLGRIVFWARLAGGGVTTSNDTSIWTNRPGPLVLFQREGDAVPNSTDFFVGFGTPAWTNVGQLGFTGSVGSGAFSFPTTLAEVIEFGGLVAPVAKESAQVPTLGLLQLNDSGFPAHWDPKLRIPRGQVVAAASIVSPKY